MFLSDLCSDILVSLSLTISGDYRILYKIIKKNATKLFGAAKNLYRTKLKISCCFTIDAVGVALFGLRLGYEGCQVFDLKFQTMCDRWATKVCSDCVIMFLVWNSTI